jgi:hypothetical protein
LESAGEITEMMGLLKLFLLKDPPFIYFEKNADTDFM